MRIDPFYPVVPSAEWVARLVPAGTRFIQLRLKDKPQDELRRQVREARAICQKHDAALVVNDHWQIAIDEKCAWVHLGQEDLLDADLPAIRRAGLRLGVSTHDHAELEKGLAAQPDYVALGPIWPTALKKMPWAPQGLERIGEWKTLIGDRPLVAIGGLTLERAIQCLRAGADCAAVVGDIVNNRDPVAQARRWMDELRACA
ncbi:MAG TPA: thiamine phosphate synthase [Reyranella sp.]|nr:thiamine phosphate synthase [Reyranella sp.]